MVSRRELQRQPLRLAAAAPWRCSQASNSGSTPQFRYICNYSRASNPHRMHTADRDFQRDSTCAGAGTASKIVSRRTGTRAARTHRPGPQPAASCASDTGPQPFASARTIPALSPAGGACRAAAIVARVGLFVAIVARVGPSTIVHAHAYDWSVTCVD